MKDHHKNKKTAFIERAEFAGGAFARYTMESIKTSGHASAIPMRVHAETAGTCGGKGDLLKSAHGAASSHDTIGRACQCNASPGVHDETHVSTNLRANQTRHGRMLDPCRAGEPARGVMGMNRYTSIHSARGQRLSSEVPLRCSMFYLLFACSAFQPKQLARRGAAGTNSRVARRGGHTTCAARRGGRRRCMHACLPDCLRLPSCPPARPPARPPACPA